MTSLLVFAFTDEGGADGMIADLQSLQQRQLIAVLDAATVIRLADGKVKIKQAINLCGTCTPGGIFWGVLSGVLFFNPWPGLPVGASAGATTSKLTDYGIDDRFIKEVGVTVRPGNSAIFLIIESMAEDRIIEAVSTHRATILRTDLSEEDEVRLQEAFGAADLEG
jgi:uncharacterized membrane protein